MAGHAAETGGESREAYCPICAALKAAHEAKEGLKRCVPAEFWQHRAAAQREGLMALRSLIDAALAHTEVKPVRKATRIKVE